MPSAVSSGSLLASRGILFQKVDLYWSLLSLGVKGWEEFADYTGTADCLVGGIRPGDRYLKTDDPRDSKIVGTFCSSDALHWGELFARQRMRTISMGSKWIPGGA